MSNQNYEIVKNAEGRYDLMVDGQFVKSYSRKADAQRGYLRMGRCAESGAGRGDTTATEAAHLPPASNTGGQTGVSTVSERTTQIVVVNGKAKEIPLRQGSNTAAHIDTITFTFTKEVLIDHETPLDDKHPENVRELAEKLSSTMHTLFGFGISEQKNGINGYKYSFVMGSHTTKYGVVAFGGSNQKDSIMVHLYGDGLTAAIDGWETRLYNWLDVFAPFAKITRCDLAHDFFDGQYTPDQAYQSWQQGGFDNRGQRPRARLHGYDWLDDKRTGKTFYVGTPNSSRLVRVYDKGCEQGDNTSRWVRFELQLRNRDYIIPHDILINAGGYLTAAYPVCQVLFEQYRDCPAKAERVKKTQEINLEHVVKYASQSSSSCINLMEWLGLSDSEIVKLLKGGKAKQPKRLGADKEDCRQANMRYLHEMKEMAQCYDFEVYRYMQQIDHREQQAKFNARMNKLEEQAKLYRMERAFNNSWYAAYADVF